MKNSLAQFAIPGTTLAVRVTPNARAGKVEIEADAIKVSVTATPSDGKANAAVIKLLSKALGVAKSHITLVRGHTSRNKVFRVD